MGYILFSVVPSPFCFYLCVCERSAGWGTMGTSILPLLEVEIFEWCIKELKWYSSYLLNTSLKGLDHFILIRIMTLLEIV